MASSDHGFFARKYRVVIKKGNSVLLDCTSEPDKLPLDIKFDISFAARQKTGRTGTVSILGLKETTILTILKLSAMDRAKALNEMVKLTLYVGYENTGMMELISGYVWKGVITSPPEKWLTMSVSEVPPMGGPRQQFNLLKGKTPYKLKVIVNGLAGKFGLSVSDMTQDKVLTKGTVTKEKFISGLCTLQQALSKIEALYDWDVVVKGECIELYDKNPEKYPKGWIEVSASTGLLGVSGVTCTDAAVTVLIHPIPLMLGRAFIQSELNPQANGFYKVGHVGFKGHYYGKEWYCTLFCTARKS